MSRGDDTLFSAELRRLREAAGLTQEELAERAARYFQDALELTFEVLDRTNAAYCMQGLAAVAASRGEPGRAARLLGAAEALLETAGIPLYAQVDLELHQRTADAGREQLGERAWAAAWDGDARCLSRRP